MSIEAFHICDGAETTPSTIIGGDDEITSTLTSGSFLLRLEGAGLRAEVVADCTVSRPQYSYDARDDARQVPFPETATEFDAFGRRRFGRFALNIAPPLDKAGLARFRLELNEARGPIARDHRAGHEGSIERITTEELDRIMETQLAQQGAR
jgi:hypothetical protein